jgi:hypothetical protein
MSVVVSLECKGVDPPLNTTMTDPQGERVLVQHGVVLRGIINKKRPREALIQLLELEPRMKQDDHFRGKITKKITITVNHNHNRRQRPSFVFASPNNVLVTLIVVRCPNN